LTKHYLSAKIRNNADKLKKLMKKVMKGEQIFSFLHINYVSKPNNLLLKGKKLL